MDSIKPKKFLGQHFLTDLSVAQRIANTVDAYPDIPILEVGPGMGVLTQYIIPKGRPFKVVEIDFDSVPYLHEHFPLLGDNIIEGDFLQMDLQTVFDRMVPQYIIGMMYDIMMQSAASENAARMTAMQNATRNADEMIAVDNLVIIGFLVHQL